MKQTKRFLAVLLAVLMLVCMASTANATVYDSPTVYVSYTGQVVNTITFNGKTVQAVYAPYHSITNYDGSSYSCAAFVSKFYNICFGIGVNNLFPGRQPNVYSGSGSFSLTSSPVVGDILGSDGHWAIVKAVSGNTVTLIEQNCWKDNERTTARYDRRVSLPDGEYKYLWHYSGNNGGSTNVYLDLNGYLDGQSINNIAPYGTVDVYINGSRVADDCSDFHMGNGLFPQGTTYEIKDIKSASGYIYNGVKSGSLMGTLNSNTFVELSFSTDIGNDFYAFLAKKSSSKNLEASPEVTQEQQGPGLNNLQLAKSGNDSTDPHQIWRFIKQSNGTYKIQNMYDDSVLDVYDAKIDNLTNVITTNDDHGRQNQRWIIYKVSGGFQIVPAHATNKALDVYGDRESAGSNVCIHDQNTSNAQIFSISKISYTKPAKPTASTVSLWVLNTANKASWLSWTESPLKDSKFDNRSYTLILTKDGVAYQTKTDLKSTSIDLTLPAGTYTAKIRAINTKYKNYYTDGNTLTFTVGNHIHSYTSTITKPATCSATGIRTYTCSCGDSYTETIAKNASNHVNTSNISATASTCTVNGYTAGVYCNDCKQYISGHQQQPLAAHTITIINQRDATQDAEGYTGDEYCTVCKQTIKQGTVIQKLDKPADPTPDTPPYPQPENLCPWCGGEHTGFFGGLVGFFHRIFAAIFGARH